MAPLVVNMCINIVKWTPVLFITAVLVWSYYAYVLQMCLFTIDNVPQQVLFLLLFHPLFIMVMWSYWKTIFTECGEPPKDFYLSSTDLDQFETAQSEDDQRAILASLGATLPVLCRTSSGDFRYCEKCKCIKPDRAHHCSACGKCVLKMDHHCPWVNNCVSFITYKFFILFLGYALVYCIFIAATSLQFFIKFWSTMSTTSSSESTRAPAGSIQIVFLTLVSCMFSISIITLFGYHSYLVTRNTTTLESFRAPVFRSGPDKNGFSLGAWSNFLEVFGDKKALWLLPVFSGCGDGVTYPTRVAQPPPSCYHTMESVQSAPPLGSDPPDDPPTAVMPSSYGDGVTYPVRSTDEDFDSLLGQRQRWMEEGAGERAPGYENQAVYGTNR